MPDNEHAMSAPPKVAKTAKSKNRFIVSSPAVGSAQRVLLAAKDHLNNDKIELTMEENLLRWKQAKQEALQSKKILGGSRRDSKGKDLAAGGNKRKLTESKTIDCLSKTASVRSPTFGHSNVPRKNLRLSVSNDHNKPTLASSPTPVVFIKVKSRLLKSSKATKTIPEVRTPENGSAQNPIVIENDREMPVPVSHAPSNPTPVLKKLSPETKISSLQLTKTFGGDPALDKENQPEMLVFRNQNRPAPVATVEKKPELLAKDLVRIAIVFEKKHRLATAFSIFKRANHVLPKKSVKLTERLARLEHECTTVADQLPSQEMPTAIYMVKVLERDLMAVLNDGSTKSLQSCTQSAASGLHWYATSVHSKRYASVVSFYHLRVIPSTDFVLFVQLQELQKVPGISANVITKLYAHHTHWENHQ